MMQIKYGKYLIKETPILPFDDGRIFVIDYSDYKLLA